MNTLLKLKRILKSEQGVGMALVLSFMGLSVPMIVAALAMAGTYSEDSQVKSRLAKSQYSSIAALEYIRYLSDDPQRWDDWLDETGGEETIDLGDGEVQIDADPDGYTDNGFLDYCVFGSTSVHVKENSVVNCSIGSNGNIEIKEDSEVNGNITSGGNVVLKENVHVYGYIKAAGTVSMSSGATATGGYTEGAVVEPIAGPTPNYGVNITVIDSEGNVVAAEHLDVEGSELGLTFNLQAGGPDVTVNSGQSYNLAPGSYGTVEVKENATLNLTSGNYAFEQIRIKEGTTINLNVSGGAIVFDAVTMLEFKENIDMNVTGGSAADVVVRVENQALFKEDGQYKGTYFGFEAALADMHVKENSTLTGALYGDTVEVKENSTVTGMPASAVYLSFFAN